VQNIGSSMEGAFFKSVFFQSSTNILSKYAFFRGFFSAVGGLARSGSKSGLCLRAGGRGEEESVKGKSGFSGSHCAKRKCPQRVISLALRFV